MCYFPLISVFDVDRLACFVFNPRIEGKLANISVSNYATMPTLDTNIDETTNEKGRGDTLYSFEVAVAPPMWNFASPILSFQPNVFIVQGWQ